MPRETTGRSTLRGAVPGALGRHACGGIAHDGHAVVARELHDLLQNPHDVSDTAGAESGALSRPPAPQWLAVEQAGLAQLLEGNHPQSVDALCAREAPVAAATVDGRLAGTGQEDCFFHGHRARELGLDAVVRFEVRSVLAQEPRPELPGEHQSQLLDAEHIAAVRGAGLLLQERQDVGGPEVLDRHLTGSVRGVKVAVVVGDEEGKECGDVVPASRNEGVRKVSYRRRTLLCGHLRRRHRVHPERCACRTCRPAVMVGVAGSSALQAAKGPVRAGVGNGHPGRPGGHGRLHPLLGAALVCPERDLVSSLAFGRGQRRVDAPVLGAHASRRRASAGHQAALPASV